VSWLRAIGWRWLALLPAGAYLAFILRYGVNAVVLDQWAVVSLLHLTSHGSLTLAALWAPHNENRMLFSNLLMIALNLADHVEVRVDLLASACLLLLALVILIWTHGRTTKAAKWVVLPAAFAVLSLNQFATTLSGFAVALYLVLLCLAAALALLSVSQRRPAAFWAAVAVAVVASYSSAQGLGIWAAGLVFILVGLRDWRRLAQWTSAAVVVVVIYVINLGSAGLHGQGTTLLHHPGQSVAFFALLVGAAIPRASRIGLTPEVLAVLGALLLLVALVAVGWWFRHRSDARQLALPLALVGFGVAVDVLVTVGRAHHGFLYAESPRYIWVNLWLAAGVWLAAAEMAGLRPHAPGWVGMALAVGVLTLLIVGLGYPAGIKGGEQARARDLAAAALTTRYRSAPAEQVVKVVGIPPGEFRRLAGYLQAARLNGFRS